jgi:hypothetical protein
MYTCSYAFLHYWHDIAAHLAANLLLTKLPKGCVGDSQTAVVTASLADSEAYSIQPSLRQILHELGKKFPLPPGGGFLMHSLYKIHGKTAKLWEYIYSHNIHVHFLVLDNCAHWLPIALSWWPLSYRAPPKFSGKSMKSFYIWTRIGGNFRQKYLFETSGATMTCSPQSSSSYQQAQRCRSPVAGVCVRLHHTQLMET